MRRRQRGASLLFVAVVVALLIAVLVAALTMFRSSSTTATSERTATSFAAAHAALEQFAGASGRLPCPANPALDTGDEDPAGPSAACTFPAGTIPWRTIGMRREDSFDAWGWRISYRVYTGAAGSLTQADGASMVNCDSVEAWSAGTGPGGVCRAAHDTSEAEFLAGKGLVVTDFGAAHNDVAYVLISHGPSGNGAFTSAGMQKDLPAAANTDERNNVSATGPFVAKAATGADVGPEMTNHFDDLLAYRSLADFARRAKLAARDWPESAAGYASVKADAPTLQAALETPSPPAYGDIGRSSVNFQNARVTAFSSGAQQNLAFDVSNGIEGLGGSGGGSTLSSANSEKLQIDFNQTATQFAVTLNDLNTFIYFSSPSAELVEFRFYNGLLPVGSPLTMSACRDTGPASFSIAVGADFNRVEITPLPSTAATVPTAFFLAEFKTCATADPCHTTMEPGTLCP